MNDDYDVVFGLLKKMQPHHLKVIPEERFAISRQIQIKRHPTLPMPVPIAGFMFSDWLTGNKYRFFIGAFQGMVAGVEAIALSRNGKRFAAAYLNNLIEIWNLETGQESPSFVGHTAEIEQFSISPDGTRLIARYKDGILKIWDLVTCEELNTFNSNKDEKYIGEVAFTLDGKWVVVAEEKNILVVRDLVTEEVTTKFIGECPFKCVTTTKLEDRNWIFAGDEIGTVWALELVE